MCAGQGSDWIDLTAEPGEVGADGIHTALCNVTPIRLDVHSQPVVSINWCTETIDGVAVRLTPAEARRIAAELIAAADTIEGTPKKLDH
ncbi:hypothetical protein Rwratislav_31604 [Rhodococcus wratislaviensis IFP 2016]|nr:hypothetical protein Rwratislav_31604 [Rhodococcus wratislaviensis IFP 2016]